MAVSINVSYEFIAREISVIILHFTRVKKKRYLRTKVCLYNFAINIIKRKIFTIYYDSSTNYLSRVITLGSLFLYPKTLTYFLAM